MKKMWEILDNRRLSCKRMNARCNSNELKWEKKMKIFQTKPKTISTSWKNKFRNCKSNIISKSAKYSINR